MTVVIGKMAVTFTDSHTYAIIKGYGKYDNRSFCRKVVEDTIEGLDVTIQIRLDGTVLGAYGWPHNMSDEGILERLQALNLERAGSESSQPGVPEIKL